jgi:hypothetical protein
MKYYPLSWGSAKFVVVHIIFVFMALSLCLKGPSSSVVVTQQSSDSFSSLLIFLPQLQLSRDSVADRVHCSSLGNDISVINLATQAGQSFADLKIASGSTIFFSAIIIPKLRKKVNLKLTWQLALKQLEGDADYKANGPAMELLEDDFSSACLSSGFLSLSAETLNSLLARDGLATKEVEVFCALIRWADHRIRRSATLSPNSGAYAAATALTPAAASVAGSGSAEVKSQLGSRRREVLGTLLRWVRFPLMKLDELMVVYNAGVLTEEQVLALCIFVSSPIGSRERKQMEQETLPKLSFTSKSSFALRKGKLTMLGFKFDSKVTFIGPSMTTRTPHHPDLGEFI